MEYSGRRSSVLVDGIAARKTGRKTGTGNEQAGCHCEHRKQVAADMM